MEAVRSRMLRSDSNDTRSNDIDSAIELSSSLSPPPELPAKKGPKIWKAKEISSYNLPSKDYLVAGLYSRRFKDGPQQVVLNKGRESSRPKSVKRKRDGFEKIGILPLPICWGAHILLEQERDFFLPYHLMQWSTSQCRLDYLERSRVPRPYIKIRNNILCDRPRYGERDIPICQCRPPLDGRMKGCGEDCINRMMQYECHKEECPCGTLCSNQRIQQRQSFKELQVFFTGSRGFGLRTLVPIRAGDFIIEYRGEIMDRESYWKRLATEYNASNGKSRVEVYALDYEQGEIIDATLKGSDARYINHSCDPNAQIQKWYFGGEFLIGVFAQRDIEAGQEITYDYGFSYWTPDSTTVELESKLKSQKSKEIITKKQPCHCGAKVCSGWIGVRAVKRIAPAESRRPDRRKNCKRGRPKAS